MTELIAGKTLLEWQDFSRTDRCLDEMVPSDLRQLVGVLLAATTYSTSGAEDRWIEDCENACPYCGGSGHKDDIHAALAAQLANEAYERAAGVLDFKAGRYIAENADIDPNTGEYETPTVDDEWLNDWAHTASAIRALKSDDTPGQSPPVTTAPLPGRAVSSVAPAAWQDTIAERKRQIEIKGWTADHDDNEHGPGDLASAGICYALSSLGYHGDTAIILELWPFDGDWWKPKGRRDDLVRAGALILAEIERLDRATLSQKGDS